MADRMLDATTSSFLGHAQIHREGYRDKRASHLLSGIGPALKSGRLKPVDAMRERGY